MKDLTPLVNRLRKQARRWARWARREGVTAYRVYDFDIPEFRLTVDRYGDAAVATTFPTARAIREGRELDPAALRRAVAEGLGLPAEDVFIKRKAPKRWGREQYERESAEGRRVAVEEYGARFWVNLSDYVDTGLFLDHRGTRQRVREEAGGKDVLNLFSYTGAFSVHAALGGARRVTSVDLSNTYLAWFQENLHLSGLDRSRHEVVRSDVMRWVRQSPERQWDLAVVDPPSWSNSKKMVTDFEVQRDHVDLIRAVRRLLRPGGVIYFSTHYRSFEFDPTAASGCRWEELTPASIPPDFRRRDVHRCFRLQT